MTHIEFLGVPGSGKSSVHRELIKDKSLYGGIDDGGVKRFFSGTNLGYLPLFVYQFGPFQQIVNVRVIEKMFHEFVSENPEFLRTLSYIIDNAEEDKCRLSEIIVRKMGRYQLGISTVKESEWLLLDSSMYGTALTIARRSDGEFPGKFLDSVPTPDTIIHLDVPPEVCLGRQLDRGFVAFDSDIKNVKDMNERIVEKAINDGIDVITVENVGPLRDTVRNIVGEL